MQIGEQRRNSLVGSVADLLQIGLDVVVMIPVAVDHRHKAYAMLDKTPAIRQQVLKLAVLGSSIP